MEYSGMQGIPKGQRNSVSHQNIQYLPPPIFGKKFIVFSEHTKAFAREAGPLRTLAGSLRTAGPSVALQRGKPRQSDGEVPSGCLSPHSSVLSAIHKRVITEV